MDILKDYPEAKVVCEFVEYYDQHRHELCRCDGTFSTYWTCKSAIAFVKRIYKYGEHYLSQGDIYTFRSAKAFIRVAARRVKQNKRMRGVP